MSFHAWSSEVVRGLIIFKTILFHVFRLLLKKTLEVTMLARFGWRRSLFGHYKALTWVSGEMAQQLRVLTAITALKFGFQHSHGAS